MNLPAMRPALRAPHASRARQRLGASVRRLATVVLLATGCAHTYIENTTVRDTQENREIYNLVVKVRDALERRDASALLALVSTKYFEDNGTADPRDDYGYTELADKVAQESMAAAKEVYVTFEVHDVVVQDDYAYVDVRYATRTRLELPAGRVWDTFRDFDRIEFTREDGGWRIISGL